MPEMLMRYLVLLHFDRNLARVYPICNNNFNFVGWGDFAEGLIWRSHCVSDYSGSLQVSEGK